MAMHNFLTRVHETRAQLKIEIYNNLLVKDDSRKYYNIC